MRPVVRVVVWGIAGVVLAALLSWGAFAIAGDSIRGPAEPIPAPTHTDEPSLAPSPTQRPTPTNTFTTPGESTSSEAPTASPTEDHGDSRSPEPSGTDPDHDDD